MNRNSYYATFTIVSFFIISLFSACRKDETQTVTPPSPPKIAFVNSIPALTNLDFYVGPSKIASITRGFSSAYVELDAGKKEISVNKVAGNEKLASSIIDIQNGSSFAVFLCGTESKTELLSVEYSYGLQNSSKAKVRFINLSQSQGGLSLNIKGMQPSYIGQPYKRVTSFESMDPINEISYEIRKINEESVSASLEKTKLEAGKIYTLIAFDDLSSTGQSIIKLNIMQNN